MISCASTNFELFGQIKRNSIRNLDLLQYIVSFPLTS